LEGVQYVERCSVGECPSRRERDTFTGLLWKGVQNSVVGDWLCVWSGSVVKILNCESEQEREIETAQIDVSCLVSPNDVDDWSGMEMAIWSCGVEFWKLYENGHCVEKVSDGVGGV